MSDIRTFQQWIGRKVVGSDGSKIGRIDQIYVEETSRRPVWMTVHTGLFGARTSFVPLQAAKPSGDDIAVPYTKDDVKSSPAIGSGNLDASEQDALRKHYALPGSGDGRPGGQTSGSGQAPGMAAGTAASGMAASDMAASGMASSGRTGAGTGTAGQTGMSGRAAGMATGAAASGTASGTAASGRTGAESGTAGQTGGSGAETDGAMIRSEEELRVGTESVESGRARLHKHVETERVQTTVPLSHEEVRLEREPITAADRPAATEGPELSEADYEVVLHEERPVVRKEVVPKERLRLAKEVVSEERTISDQVRKERIDIEGLDTQSTGRDGLRRRPGQ